MNPCGEANSCNIRIVAGCHARLSFVSTAQTVDSTGKFDRIPILSTNIVRSGPLLMKASNNASTCSSAPISWRILASLDHGFTSVLKKNLSLPCRPLCLRCTSAACTPKITADRPDEPWHVQSVPHQIFGESASTWRSTHTHHLWLPQLRYLLYSFYLDTLQNISLHHHLAQGSKRASPSKLLTSGPISTGNCPVVSWNAVSMITDRKSPLN